MTRKVYTCTLTALLLLWSSLSAGVPGLMNYQGRLTDNLGDPVPDGVYSVSATIYDAAVGGASYWTETQNVTTSGGLFTVTLGAVNPIPDTVFSADTRYLGIQVGADPELSPRTALVSVPYAQRISTVDGSTGGSISGDVDVASTSTGNALSVSQLGLGRGGFFQVSNGANSEAAVQGTHVGSGPGGSFFSDGGGPGIVATSTFGVAAELYGSANTYGDMVAFDGGDSAVHVDVSGYMLRTFGSDGLEQIRLWGSSYGEVRLHDNSDNDLTALLSATSNGGGALQLMDELGAIQLSLSGGNSGDASAVLPGDAINRSEILDEPGLAGVRQGGTIVLPLSGSDTVAIRTITVPVDGYVVALATGQLNVSHNEGLYTFAAIYVVPPGEIYTNSPTSHVSIPALAPDGQYAIPATVTAVFSVNAGANQFRLEARAAADNNLGSASISRGELVLLFLPTLYGTVNPNNAAAALETDITARQELDRANAWNEQRIQDELTEVRTKLDALQTQLNQSQN